MLPQMVPGTRLRMPTVARLRCRSITKRREWRRRTRWTDNGLIFTTRTGGPLDERNVAQQDFIRVLNAAKLPTAFRLYDLRHTAATLALAAGVQPKVVSEMLGHASAAFTLDVYSHLLPHMQDSAAAKVGKLLMGRQRKK